MEQPQRLPATDVPGWKPTASLHEAGPDDAVYTLDEADEGTTIRFGEGIQGRRPPPGTIIHVQYSNGDQVAVTTGAGNIDPVTFLERASLQATPDQPLWEAIRLTAEAITFKDYRRTAPSEAPATELGESEVNPAGG